jgi:hypothetical protein
MKAKLKRNSLARPDSGKPSSEVRFPANVSTAKTGEMPGHSRAYVAKPYRLPMWIAGLFAWHAELRRTLS